MTDRMIEDSIVDLLQNEFNSNESEVLKFPDLKEEFTFNHPNASILVNTGDILPGKANLTYQELTFEIEFNVYARRMRGVGGASDICFRILKRLTSSQPDLSEDGIIIASGYYDIVHWQRLEVTEDYILTAQKFNYNASYIRGY